MLGLWIGSKVRIWGVSRELDVQNFFEVIGAIRSVDVGIGCLEFEMVVWSSNKVEMGFVLCFAMPSLEWVFEEPEHVLGATQNPLVVFTSSQFDGVWSSSIASKAAVSNFVRDTYDSVTIEVS
ncbi:hypothetical protein Droror1_Dr00028176 [Drosera rotundifolia]